MMKRIALFLLTALVCFAEPTVEQVKKGYHGSDKTYGKALYYTITNDITSYMVYLQWVKVTATEVPKVLVGLPEPWFFSGFLSRGYSSLIVNGISSTVLEPKKVEPFSEDGKAGVEMLYNFNGCRLFQRIYMVDGKPLLYTQWRKDPSCQEPIQAAELLVSARPSMVIQKYDYKRAMQTKSRLIDTPAKGTKWTDLKADDKYWILYDKELEPSKKKGAEGPCYLTADWAGIKSAKVWYGHVYSMQFRFTLDVTKDSWTIGTVEFHKSSDNAPFIERVKNEEDKFSL
ncbi:MAG: hypothetical protein J5746_11620 [Victivallales bacterium]|nr:hypothetical protein [Victivallales bacterium]